MATTFETNEHGETVRVITSGDKVRRELVRPPPPVAVRVISQTEFLRRLTTPELEGILAAAKVSIAIEAWVYRFDHAGDVNLDDPLTVEGLAALESEGLLGARRAAEILE